MLDNKKIKLMKKWIMNLLKKLRLRNGGTRAIEVKNMEVREYVLL
jgi:hypothetical protein